MDEINTNGAEVTACQMSRINRNNYVNMARIHSFDVNMAIRENLRRSVILIVLIVIKQMFYPLLSKHSLLCQTANSNFTT